MARGYKFVGAVRLDASDTRLWIRVGAGAWFEASIPGGLYYAAGDSQPFDLILALNTALAGSPDILAGLFTFDKQTGLWALANFTGSTIQLTCVAPGGFPDTGTLSPGGRAIFDYLKIQTTDTRLFSSGTLHGSINDEIHHGGFYPALYMTEDRPVFDARTRQSVPDRGPVQTLTFGYLRKQVIGVRLRQGYPRKSGETEWSQLNDFMARHLRGIPFRFYPAKEDEVVSSLPFSEGFNPLGYHTLVIDTNRTTWEPGFPFTPNLAVLDATLECWVYTPR